MWAENEAAVKHRSWANKGGRRQRGDVGEEEERDCHLQLQEEQPNATTNPHLTD